MTENQRARNSSEFTTRAFNRERRNVTTETFASGFPYSKLNRLGIRSTKQAFFDRDFCSSPGNCPRIDLASTLWPFLLEMAGFCQAVETVSNHCHVEIAGNLASDPFRADRGIKSNADFRIHLWDLHQENVAAPCWTLVGPRVSTVFDSQKHPSIRPKNQIVIRATYSD
jgi:hypothetical protein